MDHVDLLYTTPLLSHQLIPIKRRAACPRALTHVIPTVSGETTRLHIVLATQTVSSEDTPVTLLPLGNVYILLVGLTTVLSIVVGVWALRWTCS